MIEETGKPCIKNVSYVYYINLEITFSSLRWWMIHKVRFINYSRWIAYVHSRDSHLCYKNFHNKYLSLPLSLLRHSSWIMIYIVMNYLQSNEKTIVHRIAIYKKRDSLSSSTIRVVLSVHHSGMSRPLKEHIGIGRQGRVEISGILRPQVHTGWQNERLHRSMYICK